MSKHHVQAWYVVEERTILNTLKHVSLFGIAIAWVEFNNKRCEIGLVFPIQTTEFWHAFIRHLFLVSKVDAEYPELGGMKCYSTPISSLVPGDGGYIELAECLYVPPEFYDLDSQSDKTQNKGETV